VEVHLKIINIDHGRGDGNMITKELIDIYRSVLDGKIVANKKILKHWPKDDKGEMDLLINTLIEYQNEVRYIRKASIEDKRKRMWIYGAMILLGKGLPYSLINKIYEELLEQEDILTTEAVDEFIERNSTVREAGDSHE
jgi:hypothetical protein